MGRLPPGDGSEMICEAEGRRLERHRGDYMGRVHSVAFLYFPCLPLSNFKLRASFDPPLSSSGVFPAPRRGCERSARFASAPRAIICCFRSRGTIFERLDSGRWIRIPSRSIDHYSEYIRRERVPSTPVAASFVIFCITFT